MKHKTALTVCLVVCATLMAIGLYLWRARPETIVLPDGSKLILAAVTVGKHHQFPDKKVQATRFNTTNDLLCLWFREEYTNRPFFFRLLEFDPAGPYFAGREAFVRRFPAGRKGDVACFAFDTFPRREGQALFQVETRGAQPQVLDKKLTVHFSVDGKFPRWQPQSLPATQTDGDLAITLTQFVYGVSLRQAGQTTTNPLDQAVLATFQVTQNGTPIRTVRPAQIETWDATGNHSDGRILNSRRNGDDFSVVYQCGLSPDEPWKIRATFARTAGFSAEETLTVTNIPVVTNLPAAGAEPEDGIQVKAGDTTLTAFSAVRTPAGLTILHVRIDPPPPPPVNLHFQLMTATDQNGKRLPALSRSWTLHNFRFNLRTTNATAINATFALPQQDPTVEFTVRPTRP